jgi:hypothetical protein
MNRTYMSESYLVGATIGREGCRQMDHYEERRDE